MTESELQHGQAESRWKAGLALFLFLFVIVGGLTLQTMQYQHKLSWADLGVIFAVALFPWGTMMAFLAFHRRLPVWLPVTSLFLVIAGWIASLMIIWQMTLFIWRLFADSATASYFILPLSDCFACVVLALSVWCAFLSALDSRRIDSLKSMVLGASIFGAFCGLITAGYANMFHRVWGGSMVATEINLMVSLPLLLITVVVIHYSNEAIRATSPDHGDLSLVEGLAELENYLEGR